MKALIIDDEPMAAKYLKGLIEENCFEIDYVEMINSPIQAIKHLSSFSYDIIFLDVEMPTLNGFEFLERVFIPRSTSVIFTTTYAQYAVDAFKTKAIHYLLKIVNKEELIKAVRKVKANSREKLSTGEVLKDKLSIYEDNEYHLVSLNDIIRLEASGSYTNIITVKRTYLASKRLGYFEKKIQDRRFVRCHKSHIVNLERVDILGKEKDNYLIMDNSNIVPISHRLKAEIQESLGI